MSEVKRKVNCTVCGKMCAQRADKEPRKHECVPAVPEISLASEEYNASVEVPDPGSWYGSLCATTCFCGAPVAEGDQVRDVGGPESVYFECKQCADEQTIVKFDDPVDPRMAGGGAAVLAAGLDLTPDQFMDPAEPDGKPSLNVSGQPDARYEWRGNTNLGYLVTDPEQGDFRLYKNGKPKGLTRVTTFVKAASDSKALNDWGKRNVVRGASMRPDVLRRAYGLTHENDRRELDAIVSELETAAGAKVSADEGTFLHAFTEEMDAGLKTWRDAPPAYQADLERYAVALAQAGLDPVPGLIERTVMVREFGGVVGTFDRVFYHRPSGTYVIGDLKTGKTLQYGIDEIQAQLWLYAHGVNQNGLYDWHTDTWSRTLDGREWLPVREDWGVIVHMPVQGPEAGSVYLRKANLGAGSRYAELCSDVRGWTRSKVVAWDGLDTVPEPSWFERFAAVTSGEEATELWRAAKAEGWEGPALNSLIAIARHALAGKG